MSRQYKNGKCSCWAAVRRQLKKDDTDLDVAWDMNGKTYLKIATYSTGHRRICKSVVASYCPFCGMKLDTTEATDDQ